MQDFVPLGTGNSRSLKSAVPAGTTWEQALAMLRNGTFPIDIGAVNEAGVSQKGTPLNKATLLKDATALLFGLTTEAVPDDVFALLERFNNGLGNEYIWKKYLQTSGEESYVNSPDPEAYPPKVPDGYQYSGPVQLGTFAGIETGSYTGTGTYGENNPNRLTFKGKPIVVFIADHNDPSSHELMRVWMFPCFAYNRNNNEYDDPGYFNIAESSGNGYGQPEYIFAKVSGTTLMWYGKDSADDQINQSTYRYYYFALTSLGGAST